MYVIKMKIALSDAARAAVPARNLPVLESCARWQACVVRYDTLEEAEAMIRRRLAAPDRFGCLRQWRIFKVEGRKQTLVKEIGE